jgi:transcriptional regulator EpsA
MMNILDFDFNKSRTKSTVVDPTKKHTRNGCSKRRAPLPAPDPFPLTVNEGERFLRIVAQASRIKRHYELFELLQGEEIQHFIPHQVLISAWGDFDGPNLKLDVISAIPGVRTGLINRCAIDGLLTDLYKRWLTHGRRPLLLNSTMDVRLAYSACGGTLHDSSQGIGSLLVHGVINARDGSDGLYLALNASAIMNGHSIERFSLLADSLITQIDVAFRRIAALKSPDLPTNQEPPSVRRVLSAREEEILLWLSEGKPNVEIARILGISSFTVKNHVQRILKKLNATNRTEAVAKYRQMCSQPQRKTPARETTYRTTEFYA